MAHLQYIFLQRIFFPFSSSSLLPFAAFQFDCDNLFNTFQSNNLLFGKPFSSFNSVGVPPPMCLLLVYDKGEKQGIFGEKMLR